MSGRHKARTSTPVEEAQTEPADHEAVKARREREVEDHTFEGAKACQIEPVLKPEEGEAVALPMSQKSVGLIIEILNRTVTCGSNIFVGQRSSHGYRESRYQ